MPTLFQWVSPIIGLFVGLGIARILTGFASAVRSRGVSPPDWIPLVWAASIFLALLDLWWVLHDLGVIIKVWTYPLFLQFIFSPLILFFAAAMILPFGELKNGESYRESFEQHGHWALFALSGYSLEGMLEDVFYWGAPVFSWWALYTLVVLILPIIAFFSSRRAHGVIAAIYLLQSALFTFIPVKSLC